MTARKLKRIEFFAIKRELQSTHRRQADIAADYGFGTSTVSRINRSVTWENYVAGKIADKPLRRPVQANDPVVRSEKAKRLGLKPVDTKERREENDFATELKKLDEKYATVDSVHTLNLDLTGMINNNATRLGERIGATYDLTKTKSSKVATRKNSIAIVVLAVAILLVWIFK